MSHGKPYTKITDVEQNITVIHILGRILPTQENWMENKFEMTEKPETRINPLTGWLKWIEPWYWVYALLGAIIAGLIPVLLPLRVGQSGTPSQVGWVRPCGAF
jgi:hypothetical protein